MHLFQRVIALEGDELADESGGLSTPPGAGDDSLDSGSQVEPTQVEVRRPRRRLMARIAVTVAVLAVVLGILVAVSVSTRGQDELGFMNMHRLERRWRARPVRNEVLIGWDGCLIDDVRLLLEQGRLPNLQRLIDEGCMIDTYITTSKTETKPGWAEILTGYGPGVTGVYDNRDVYRDIPQGLTIFERLKVHFGKDGIRIIFLAGKLQNLGNRGRHRVRTGGNRKTWHDETLWTDDEKENTDVVWHDAEPYYTSSKSCDTFKNGLGDAPFVGGAAIEELARVKGQRFLLFAHFWEPDESGHDYGEGTTAYVKTIVENDVWLGRVMDALRQQGSYDDTAIYVLTDHGYDKGATSHLFAPHTWVVTNDTVRLVSKGDRKDMTPTLLERFGVDIRSLRPPLEGRTLLR